jgi:hypothetical protein
MTATMKTMTLASFLFVAFVTSVTAGDSPSHNSKSFPRLAKSNDNDAGDGFVELPFTATAFPFNAQDPALVSVPTTVPGGSLQWRGGFAVNFTGGGGGGGVSYGGWSSMMGSKDGRVGTLHDVIIVQSHKQHDRLTASTHFSSTASMVHVHVTNVIPRE